SVRLSPLALQMSVLCSCHFLFLVLSLRPPSSTLFPYTTLFRSLATDDPNSNVNFEGQFSRQGATPNVGFTGGRTTSNLAVSSLQDRKSTRLNSSHVKISYAVFCLKKKKTYT